MSRAADRRARRPRRSGAAIPGALGATAAIVVGGSPSAVAQDDRQFGVFAWLVSAMHQEQLPRDRCIPLPSEERLIAARVSTTCDALRYEVLGTAGGAAWSYALYRHVSIYRFPDSAEPNTVTELELVLFAGPAPGRAPIAAVAHTRQDELCIGDMAAAGAPHAGALEHGVSTAMGRGHTRFASGVRPIAAPFPGRLGCRP